MRKLIDKIKCAIAFVLWGCPICYNVFVKKTQENHIMYCPKCGNYFDRRIWCEDDE